MYKRSTKNKVVFLNSAIIFYPIYCIIGLAFSLCSTLTPISLHPAQPVGPVRMSHKEISSVVTNNPRLVYTLQIYSKQGDYAIHMRCQPQ